MGKVIGFSNFTDTIISYFKNEATAQRTYTFPDEDVDFSPVDYSEGTWVPTWTGFSADPTVQNARYKLVGKMCYAFITTSGNGGTSNATGLTVTLPFPSAFIQQYVVRVKNNGTFTVGLLQTAEGSNVATVFSAMTGAVFTASGDKMVQVAITYEIE